MTRSILSRFRDIHAEIDQLQEGDAGSKGRSARGDWRFAVRKQEDAVFEALLLISHSSDDELRSYLKDESEAAEVISCLDYEASVHAHKCRPKLLEALNLALRRVRQFTKIEAVVLPPWFLASHELVQKQTQAAAQTIRREHWSALNHPNVVRLFGVSQFCHGSVAVLEEISYSSLRDYLRAKTHHHALVWQKLYEAALGLKYLHERGVVLGALHLDSIWIGVDNVAKFAAIREVMCVGDELQRESEEDSQCWKSPEVLRGEPPMLASDVYSLGKCVLEAVTEVSADPVSSHVASQEFQQCEFLSSAQQQLADEMCSPDPLQRPNLLRVIEHLKQYADPKFKANSTSSRYQSAEQEIEASDTDIRDFRYEELQSTIKEFLARLERRLSEIAGCDKIVAGHSRHLLDRLAEIYSRFIKTDVRPNDPAPLRLCEVLTKIGRRFFRTTLSKGSFARQRQNREIGMGIAMHCGIFDRENDQVLIILLVSSGEVDLIHNWTSHEAVDNQPDIELDEVASTSEEVQGDEPDVEAVTLVVKDLETGNPLFRPIHVDWQANVSTKAYYREEGFIHIDEISYKADNHIGSGAFATVFRGTWLKAPVVIKLLKLEALCKSYDKRLFSHELRVWRPLNHPHVLKLYGACISGKLCFVCEDATHGMLLEYLGKDDDQSKVWQRLYEAALGLQYLHSQGIVHNDLKCDNLLVGADEKTKIADFGLGCIQDSVEVLIDPKQQGAIGWRSPEYLRGECVTLASDVYFFGICIVEALRGYNPWAPSTDSAVRRFVRLGRLPLKPETMTDSQWRLVELMRPSEPHDRVQISRVVEQLRIFSHQDLASESSDSEQPGDQPETTSSQDTSLNRHTVTNLPATTDDLMHPAAALAPWFLSIDELVIMSEKVPVSKGVLRGKWSSSDVTILQSALPREQFVKAVEEWPQLNHPNVIRLFGASHFCHPSVAVFEKISYSSLRDYMQAEMRHRALVWPLDRL